MLPLFPAASVAAEITQALITAKTAMMEMSQ